MVISIGLYRELACAISRALKKGGKKHGNPVITLDFSSENAGRNHNTCETNSLSDMLDTVAGESIHF